mgnify:CR=1 FL=1
MVKVRDIINTSKHSAVTSAMLSSAPDHTMFPTGVWKATLSVSNASRNVSTNHHSRMVKTTSIEAHRDTFFYDMN